MSGGLADGNVLLGVLDPQGPVFVSYRQKDGTPTARTMAWLLRACGLPVWRDREDLPPGDTNQRLDEALRAGLSAALLLVTPDIVSSAVVRNVELPRLLGLEKDENFMLALGSTVRSGSHLDYTAPDRLLGQPPGTLSRLNQYPAHTQAGRKALARALLLHRLRRRPAGPSAPLTIDVQSRAVPHANDPVRADLTIRLRPPTTGRLPNPRGLKDLAIGLSLLPEAYSASGAQIVHIAGGAHLSVAIALGAALPGTVVGRVEVTDPTGSTWRGGAVSQRGDDAALVNVGHAAGSPRATGERRHVLVYLDLREERSDAAYTRLLGETPGGFDAWTHLRPAAGGLLDPAAGEALVAEAAQEIRGLAAQHDNAEVHLLLRCPFPVAVLLGRLLNTVRVTVYEWDDDERAGDPDVRPRYVPVLRLRLGAPQGPIEAVLLT